MNPLSLWRLKQFCEQHELDIQEIDNSISYAENKEHLETFLMRTPEELAKEYGRISDITEKQPSFNEEKRESKKQWITISRTRIENVTLR